MLTGEIRGQIERLRKNLWEGGVANPLTNVEQITYLLFAKRIDEIQTLEERKAAGLYKQGYVARRLFPEGKDGLETPGFRDGGCPYELMRWSRFRDKSPEEMFEIVDAHLMPFLRTLGGPESVMASHMKGARLAFTKPALLDKLVQGLNQIPMEDRDTKGDIYEYLLSMISSAGENGQFRTPRHIIDLMVRLMNPGAEDTICDPAAGTAGFLMMAAEYVRRTTPDLFTNPQKREHFEKKAFTGFDFDETMLRIGAMNMMLHGVEEPRISYRDSLAEGRDDAGEYSMILANPPFAGSLDNESCSKDLLKVVNTKKTELLFLALFLRLLSTGGRAAVIVPDGVLFGSSKAHKAMRKTLVEDHRLEAVISLPSGVFRPYAGVSTAILIFTKTGRGGTDFVWYYDMLADGISLDDKRNPLLDESLLGAAPARPLTPEEHGKNNLPDVLARWADRAGGERDNPRTAQSFCVSREDIAATGYDLSINRYKEVVHEEINHAAPKDIIAELRALEDEIAKGLTRLEEMLG